MDQIETSLWWLAHKEKLKTYLTYSIMGLVGVIWIFALWQLGLFVFRPTGQDSINSFGVPPPVTLRPSMADIKVAYSKPPAGGDALIEIKNPNPLYRLDELTLEREGQRHSWTLKAKGERQIAWPESFGVSGVIYSSDVRWVKVDVNKLLPKINLTADDFKTELSGAQVIVSGLVRNDSDFSVAEAWVTVVARDGSDLIAARTFLVSGLGARASRLVSTTLPLLAMGAQIETSLYWEN